MLRFCFFLSLLSHLLIAERIVAQEPGSSPAAPAAEKPPAAPNEDPAPQPMEPSPLEQLSKLQDMVLPSAEELLTQNPVDWIVLVNDDVLVVEPLAPRPGTLETRRKELAAKADQRAKVLGEKREQIDLEIKELQSFLVTPAKKTELGEFRLPVRQVKQFIHHEDLMLRRFDILLKEANLDVALELLTRLERERPDWPGTADAEPKVLLLSARQRIQAGQAEAALVLLEDLRTRDPKNSETLQLITTALESMIRTSLEQNQIRTAQHFLRLLSSRSPQNPACKEFTEELNRRAHEEMRKGTESFEKEDFRSATIHAENAVRIWPLAGDLKTPFSKITSRYQRLHVGVTELAGERIAYPVPDETERRRDALTRLHLFEMAQLRDGSAYYRTRFFDEWEPRDLGRQMRFKLRQSRQPFSLHALPTSTAVAEALIGRLTPNHANYDERLDSFIESIQINSPTELTLTFRRVPPRVEPLLAELSLPIPSLEEQEAGILSHPGGFQLISQTPEEAVYQRSIPEPADQTRFHLAEIVEHRFDSPEKLVLGLRNGEISYASGLPDVDLRGVLAEVDFNRNYFVQPCLLPITHLLQFNPESSPTQIPELRKALAYSFDADKLLREVVLHDERAAHGRLVTSPFHSRSPAQQPGIRPRRVDLSKAFALALSARYKLKSAVPPLTMIVAPGRVPESAAAEIAKSASRIGIEIRIVKASDPAPEQWDILYRTLEMTEPVLEMWPFLILSDRARVDGLQAFPDWIKQDLALIDRSSDQRRAVEALQSLHQNLWEDAAYIPLWEVDQFVILRKNIDGFPEKFAIPYDSIDEWRITPWYRETLP